MIFKMKTIFSNIAFLWQFSIDDLKNKYSNSFLGIVWGFLQPMTTIVVYWFVFQLGFKSQPIKDFPFILWLIVGLIPWFFISEVIPSSTAVLVEYSYLIQKVRFNINILPLIKIVSAFVIQVFLIILTIGAFWIFGFTPSLWYLQILYYAFYMSVLSAGIAYLVSALYIFLKDLMQIITILLQIIFWATPIVWDSLSMPENVQKILVFNPVYFIIKGYRKTFIYREAFWTDGMISIYYWCVAVIILFLGVHMFRKLKPHFADVL